MTRLLPLLLTLAACDPVTFAPDGAPCRAAAECASGVCGAGRCLAGEGDLDGDGLTNLREAELGGNPDNRDGDHDGVPDADELGPAGEALDRDGDGVVDLRESRLADADGDCLVDELDPSPAPADAEAFAAMRPACGALGVCAEGLARVAVTCEGGRLLCDLGAVPYYEPTERACDGRDNDCDGVTDEAHPDADGDGRADCADEDPDNDSASSSDNCPAVSNPGQEDADRDGLGDACDPPGPIALSGAAPPSPANTVAPVIEGRAEPRLTLTFYGDEGCGRALGAGESDAAGRFAIQLAVPRDAATTLYVRGTNRAGLATDCRPAAMTYISDATAPPAALGTCTPTGATRDPLLRCTFRLAPNAEPSEVLPYAFALPVGAARDDLDALDCEGSLARAEPLRVLPLEGADSATLVYDLPPDRTTALLAVTRDLAGNRGACQVVAMTTRDTQAPAPPSLTAEARDQLASPRAGAPQWLARGCAEAGATVFSYPLSDCQGTARATARATTPSPSCAPNEALWTAIIELQPNASTVFSADAVDAAGNRGACAPLGVVVHDGLAPAAPESPALVVVPVEGGLGLRVAARAEPRAELVIHDNPACAGAALARSAVDDAGAAAATFEAATDPGAVFGAIVDAAGNLGPCTPLGATRGELGVRLTRGGQALPGWPVSFHDALGAPLGERLSDADGVARLEAWAGAGLTVATGSDEAAWTSALGLAPGELVALAVEPVTAPEAGPSLPTLTLGVPTPPAGTTELRALTPCGLAVISAPLGDTIDVPFDPGCAAEDELVVLLVAVAEGRELGYLVAQHLPLGDLARAPTVPLEGPWREDFAPFTLQLAAAAPTPFEVSFGLGHHGDTLLPLGALVQTGLARSAATEVTARFPRYEHAALAFSIAASHPALGLVGQRERVERGGYLPGSAAVLLDEALPPPAWRAAIVAAGGEARLEWWADPRLFAIAEVLTAHLELEGRAWLVLARPSPWPELALPRPDGRPAELRAAPTLAALTWHDLAPDGPGRGGFARWAACGPDLRACLDAPGALVLRRSGVVAP